MTAGNTIDNSLERGLPLLVRERLFQWALMAFFFVLPFQTRWLIQEAPLYEYGTLSVFVMEIIGWVVIAFGLVRMRNVKLKMQNLSADRQDAKWLWWLGGLVVVAFSSIAWAPDKAVAFQAAVRLLEGVMLYVVVAQTFRSERGRSKDLRYIVVWSFLAGATLQAGLGIYQFLTQSTFASALLGLALHDPGALGTAVVESGGQRWLRAYGGLPHPNVLGGYLVVALAVASMMWQRLNPKDGPWPRTVLWITMLILLTGIFFSFSRTAWVVACLVILYGTIQTRRRLQKFTIVNFCNRGVMLTALLYMIFLATLYRPLVVSRLIPSSLERLEVKSRLERVSGAREAWTLIKRHPFMGVGIGNYTQAVARELRSNQPLWSYQPVHSVPFLVWVELGTVGFLFWVWALYKIVRQSQFYILPVGRQVLHF